LFFILSNYHIKFLLFLDVNVIFSVQSKSFNLENKLRKCLVRSVYLNPKIIIVNFNVSFRGKLRFQKKSLVFFMSVNFVRYITLLKCRGL